MWRRIVLLMVLSATTPMMGCAYPTFEKNLEDQKVGARGQKSQYARMLAAAENGDRKSFRWLLGKTAEMDGENALYHGDNLRRLLHSSWKDLYQEDIAKLPKKQRKTITLLIRMAENTRRINSQEEGE